MIEFRHSNNVAFVTLARINFINSAKPLAGCRSVIVTNLRVVFSLFQVFKKSIN